MENNFIQALHSGRVLLMDGAMGTELGRAGIQPDECYELWNVTHPDRILAIHLAYVEAGAEVILTNTFQANPAALAKHEQEGKLEDLCQEGLERARHVAGPNRFVLGDIGPGFEDCDALTYIGLALSASDGLLLETLSDAIAADISALRIPVLVSFTFLHNEKGQLQTYAGLTPEAAAKSASLPGIAALGVNCGREIDMEDTAEIIRRFRAVTDLPLFARPNAGTPIKVDGNWVYPRTPQHMAARLPALLLAGVTMVGGCCGTTPAHIAAFKPVIDNWNRELGF